jgi:hypothetical protein
MNYEKREPVKPILSDCSQIELYQYFKIKGYFHYLNSGTALGGIIIQQETVREHQLEKLLNVQWVTSELQRTGSGARKAHRRRQNGNRVTVWLSHKHSKSKDLERK